MSRRSVGGEAGSIVLRSPAFPVARPATRLVLATVLVALVSSWSSPAPAQQKPSSTVRSSSTTTRPSSTTARPVSTTANVAPSTSGTGATGSSATGSSIGGSTPTGSGGTGLGTVGSGPAGTELPIDNAPQSFPAALVAPVPASEVPVERSVTDLYVPPTTEPDTPQVVVQFRSPFTLPRRPYRVSVLAGDPNGQRLRASLTASGTPDGSGSIPVTGKLEKGDGRGPWQPVGNGTTPVQFVPSGLAIITLPLPEVPAGGAIWAEVETGTDGKLVTVTPPYALDSLLGRPADGLLPATPFGQVVDATGTVTDEVVPLSGGPTLSVANQTLRLSSTERPPDTVAGQPVQQVLDYVRIAPDYNRRAVLTHYIVVNRTDGTVRLLDGYSVPPADRTDQPGWLIDGVTSGSAAGPATISFDLPALAAALGMELGPTTSAFGVRRELVLADGRRVAADAVMGTLGWFDPGFVAATPAAPGGATAQVQDTEPTGDRRTIALVVAGVAVLGALLVGVALLVRRRRAVPGEVGDDAADELDALAAEQSAERRSRRDVSAGAGPGPSSTSEQPVVVAPGMVTDEQPAVGATSESGEVIAGTAQAPGPADRADLPAAAGEPAIGKVDPQGALDALEDDFADLSARLKRLGGDPSIG